MATETKNGSNTVMNFLLGILTLCIGGFGSVIWHNESKISDMLIDVQKQVSTINEHNLLKDKQIEAELQAVKKDIDRLNERVFYGTIAEPAPQPRKIKL